MARPPDGITIAEAAEILGCSSSHVSRLRRAGVFGPITPHRHHQLTREMVEQVSADRFRPRRTSTDDSYWITTGQAAELLDVGRQCVQQLSRAGKLPYVETDRGRRLFRRAQIEVISNARISRRLR